LIIMLIKNGTFLDYPCVQDSLYFNKNSHVKKLFQDSF
jgi:hypothetical protein